MKKLTGNKVHKLEGNTLRLNHEIKCDCCGALTYTRKQKRIQKALEASCKTCRTLNSQRQPKTARRVDGRTFHPLYKTYTGMKQRCYNPNHKNYADYGGRGILVCPEWLDDFWSFVADVG